MPRCQRKNGSIWCKELHIDELFEKAKSKSVNRRDLQELRACLGERTLEEFTFKGSRDGVVLTTMYTSKGREFDYAVLPCVQKGIIPRACHEL